MDLLYFMQVPWGWIKQRPHFIAEQLSSRYEVTVAYKVNYRSRNLVPNRFESRARQRKLFVLPYARFASVAFLNRLLLKFQVRKCLRRARIVWVPDPRIYDFLAGQLEDRHFVAYDCMDDIQSFSHVASDPDLVKRVTALESALCHRSQVVFTSSENLRQKLLERYSIDPDKVRVVNNAADLRALCQGKGSAGAPLPSPGGGRKRLVYLGTIASWFDFQLLECILDRFEDVEFCLVGPAEVPIPQRERLKAVGPVPHQAIATHLMAADALIMPFQVTELIQSVNPVKLYEYIYTGKPVLAVKYGESQAFEPYVHLYEDQESFAALVDQLVKGALKSKKPLEECQAYVRRNSWQDRAEAIQACLPRE